MATRITIIRGTPGARGDRCGHALAAAYAHSAEAAGHEVTVFEVAIRFPALAEQGGLEIGALPETLRQALQASGWVEHLEVVYLLWLGRCSLC